jgi:hypothetical protein
MRLLYGRNDAVSFLLLCDGSDFCIFERCMILNILNIYTAYTATAIAECLTIDPRYFYLVGILSCSIFVYKEHEYVYQYSAPYINI